MLDERLRQGVLTADRRQPDLRERGELHRGRHAPGRRRHLRDLRPGGRPAGRLRDRGPDDRRQLRGGEQRGPLGRRDRRDRLGDRGGDDRQQHGRREQRVRDLLEPDLPDDREQPGRVQHLGARARERGSGRGDGPVQQRVRQHRASRGQRLPGSRRSHGGRRQRLGRSPARRVHDGAAAPATGFALHRRGNGRCRRRRAFRHRRGSAHPGRRRRHRGRRVGRHVVGRDRSGRAREAGRRRWGRRKRSSRT